jgi:hypothetical protein
LTDAKMSTAIETRVVDSDENGEVITLYDSIAYMLTHKETRSLITRYIMGHKLYRKLEFGDIVEITFNDFSIMKPLLFDGTTLVQMIRLRNSDELAIPKIFTSPPYPLAYWSEAYDYHEITVWPDFSKLNTEYNPDPPAMPGNDLKSSYVALEAQPKIGGKKFLIYFIAASFGPLRDVKPSLDTVIYWMEHKEAKFTKNAEYAHLETRVYENSPKDEKEASAGIPVPPRGSRVVSPPRGLPTPVRGPLARIQGAPSIRMSNPPSASPVEDLPSPPDE